MRGATGTVERVGERQTLVRLTAPVPGMLSVFAWDEGDGKATAGVRAYLFSADAADYVRREEPAWQAWLQRISVPAWIFYRYRAALPMQVHHAAANGFVIRGARGTAVDRVVPGWAHTVVFGARPYRVELVCVECL